ncbi:MAG TPA: MFS transporter [Thermomicrobiaceae bacterium]|nr:MFS transporter [Thermomicrobiaceae bacterium]
MPTLSLPDWLNRDLGFLFAGRGLRSLTQGYLAIIAPLYLAELHYSAVQIGLLFTAGSAVSAVLAALIGVLADRYGRKLFLVILALLTAVGGVVFAASGAFLVLLVAGAVSTVGRGGGAGSGGAWGPYYAAEQALLAEHSADESRTAIFGAISFIGVLTGAVGSLMAGLPSLLHATSGTTEITGDRILFLITVLFGVAMAVVMLPVHETREVRRPVAHDTPKARHHLQPGTIRMILKFMVTNTANGLGYGLLGPILVYWFYRRYGVGSGGLAELFFVINLATAPSYLFAARLARRLGAVNTVTLTRGVSVVILAVLPLMPTFFLAAVVYTVRMVTSTLGNPIRQSYLMGVIPREDRATAAGLSNLPSQVFASFGPTMAGYMIQDLSLNLPIEVAAVFQALNTVLYFGFFRHIRPPEESVPHATAPAPQPAASRQSSVRD